MPAAFLLAIQKIRKYQTKNFSQNSTHWGNFGLTPFEVSKIWDYFFEKTEEVLSKVWKSCWNNPTPK